MSKQEGTITVNIGSVVANNGGVMQDNQLVVEFEGRKLAERTEYGYVDGGGVTDLYGVTETLYQTEDGRYVVHVNDWSRWRGEPTTASLHEVTEDDLKVSGRFDRLGTEAGMGRPLTLDEALEAPEEP